jgi:hypothetical protein
VVGETGGVGRARRRDGERGQRVAVQRRTAVGRKRVLDRHARQLVTEGDAVGGRGQHPRGEALVEPRELVVGGQRLEQPQLGVRPGDRGGAE